jgi:hypothetical protein
MLMVREFKTEIQFILRMMRSGSSKLKVELQKGTSPQELCLSPGVMFFLGGFN